METGAIVEILDNPRYQGAIDSISGVTEFIDCGFVAVITFLAFFIISVALLRNVFAGVYCAFPKFWDQVAHAHEENKDKAFYESIKGIKDNYKTHSMSTLKTAIMRILPNIKCLTDFEEDNIAPKSYFIKAIPQMIGVVIIGVFIYNGYYRDATSLVAGTGAEFLERALLDFDPVETFDNIVNTAGRPVFATDGSITEGGKTRNKITVDIYSNIISRYSDIRTANDKAILAANIDSAVAATLGPNTEVGKYIDDPNYTAIVNVSTVKDFDQTNYRQTSSDGNQIQFGFKYIIGHDQAAIPAADASILFDSTADPYKEDWYIRVAIMFTRQSAQVSDNNVIEGGTLVVGKDESSAVTYSFAKGINFSALTSTIQGQFTYNGKTYEIKVVKDDTDRSSRSIKMYANGGGTTFEGESDSSNVTMRIGPGGKYITVHFDKIIAGDAPAITCPGNATWTFTGGGNTINFTKNASSSSSVTEEQPQSTSTEGSGPVAQ